METEFIHWLRQRLAGDRRVPLGIGDDAAIVDVGGARVVVTVDMLTAGVDFILEEVDPCRIGRKALAVNLSDMAAMAARPVAAFPAVALPRTGAANLATSIATGMCSLAEEFDVALAGGDTNCWDGPLVISVTVIGELTPHGPLLRSAARPGDRILVTGEFGGSILGKQFDFTPRVAAALHLKSHYDVRAGLDVSDGLAKDLSRLCAESGCGAVLQREHIPIAPAAHALSAQDGRTPLDHALGDGEDFELILTAPPDVAQAILNDRNRTVAMTDIGEIIAAPGMWLTNASGDREPLSPLGFEH